MAKAEPNTPKLRWFAQRQHPEKRGYIQVEGFVDEFDAHSLADKWNGERPELNAYVWEHIGARPPEPVLPAAPDRSDQSVVVHNTESLYQRLLMWADEQNTRQQVVYGAADIRDAVEREDVLRSAASAVAELFSLRAALAQLRDENEKLKNDLARRQTLGNTIDSRTASSNESHS